MESISVDIAVVGAGPAGAACAAFLAEGGRTVVLLDARPMAQAGAQWVNGVASWMFDQVGVARPKSPECRGGEHAFVAVSPSGKKRVRVDENPVLDVDIRLLGSRLRERARSAGARLFGETHVDQVELDLSGRPTALLASTPSGRLRVDARLFIDASGLKAVLRREVPVLARACPDPDRRDLCTAAQEVRSVVDSDGARRFLNAHGVRPGEAIGYSGLAGPYSVLVATVSEDLRSVGILTGSIANDGYRSGLKMLRDFASEHRWIGDVELGGSGVVPLRRPYARLVAPGVALVGDSACQVFSLHGSGIGLGMIAARLLANAVGGSPDPGDLRALWSYACEFHNEWGGLLAVSDACRRHAQGLAASDVERLCDSGLVTPGLFWDTLAQKLPRLRPRELPVQIKALMRSPRTAWKMMPMVARGAMALVAARGYPEEPDEAALSAYERRMRLAVAGPVMGPLLARARPAHRGPRRPPQPDPQ
ncbi:MAG: FAD-dependent oxidoreductase [Deltaproteobacteria bacterium]|nr:FAD-dependent oxidoreductase [Deltaproteobacteria bacterium]